MPRLVEALPKYRKHKASGQAVVTLAGRDHYLGPHGTKASKALYDRLIAEWLQQGRRAPAGAAETITVTILCARYLRFAKGYYVKDGECTPEERAYFADLATSRRLPIMTQSRTSGR